MENDGDFHADMNKQWLMNLGIEKWGGENRHRRRDDGLLSIL